MTWDLNTQVIAFYVNGKLQSREEGHGKSDVTTISLGINWRMMTQVMVVTLISISDVRTDNLMI